MRRRVHRDLAQPSKDGLVLEGGDWRQHFCKFFRQNDVLLVLVRKRESAGVLCKSGGGFTTSHQCGRPAK